MKRLLLALLAVFIASPAYSAAIATSRQIKVATNDTVMSSYYMTNGVTVTTEAIRVKAKDGNTPPALVVDVVGDVDIDYEVSLNGRTWYTPNINGSATGDVMDGVTSSQWIVMTDVTTPYIRFTFDPDADGSVSAWLVWQSE